MENLAQTVLTILAISNDICTYGIGDRTGSDESSQQRR